MVTAVAQVTAVVRVPPLTQEFLHVTAVQKKRKEKKRKEKKRERKEGRHEDNYFRSSLKEFLQWYSGLSIRLQWLGLLGRWRFDPQPRTVD